MILFCGIPSEPPIALAVEAARACGIPYVMFNQRESCSSDAVLHLKKGRASGFLWSGEKQWPLEEFTGVYTRLMEARFIPEHQPRGRRPAELHALQKCTFLAELLDEWIEIASCRIVNRTSSTLSNVSKPYQSQLIRRVGLRIPLTLVTNQPEEAIRFWHECGRVVFKSISSVRSIVQEFHPAMPGGLEKIRALPVQFQAYIPGVNIRVHVIGARLFATQIETEAIDYRYAQGGGLELRAEPFDLPAPIQCQCLSLARDLGLAFCGIDLKRTPSGDYYCFEANPSPAYSYFEELSGQPIAQALVEYLEGRTP